MLQLQFQYFSYSPFFLTQAQKLAERFGEPWLAAALEGWRLSHDPNCENEKMIEGQKLMPLEGNKYRDIWKAACWAASQSVSP